MSCRKILLKPPIYSHRSCDHDLPKAKSCSLSEQTAMQISQRIFHLTAPFIALYQPLKAPIFIGFGSIRTISFASQWIDCLKKNDDQQLTVYLALQTMLSTISLAGAIFAHPVGALLTTGQDLIIEVRELVQYVKANQDNDEAVDNFRMEVIERCVKILNNALYLALFFHRGIEVSIASLGVQTSLNIYNAVKEYSNGNYPENIAHIALAAIHGKKFLEQAQTTGSLSEQFKTGELQKKIDQNEIDPKEILHDAVLEDNPELLKFILKQRGISPDSVIPCNGYRNGLYLVELAKIYNCNRALEILLETEGNHLILSMFDTSGIPFTESMTIAR